MNYNIFFYLQLETLKQEVITTTEIIGTSKTEMTTEKTKVQSLELELQSVMAVVRFTHQCFGWLNYSLVI